MDTNAPKSSSPAARNYLYAFFVVPIIAFVFPFMAERLPVLRQWSESYYTEVLDQTYTAKNVNADVVIFGDSSALYGENTRELSRLLGMKVVNLPQTLGTLPLTKDRPIRNYLKYNKAPRLFVIHLVPWEMDAMDNEEGHFFEGEEQIIRNGSAQDFLYLLRTKFWEVVQFPFQYYLVNSRMNRLWSGSFKSDEIVQADQGHAELPEKTKRMASFCVFGPGELKTNTDSAEGLRRDFTTSQTKVLIYFPPLPACTNINELLAAPRGNLKLTPPLILPASGFQYGWPAHPLRETSEIRTQALAKAIRQAMAQ